MKRKFIVRIFNPSPVVWPSGRSRLFAVESEPRLFEGWFCMTGFMTMTHDRESVNNSMHSLMHSLINNSNWVEAVLISTIHGRLIHKNWHLE